MGGCDEKIEAEITKANYVLRVVCNGMGYTVWRNQNSWLNILLQSRLLVFESKLQKSLAINIKIVFVIIVSIAALSLCSRPTQPANKTIAKHPVQTQQSRSKHRTASEVDLVNKKVAKAMEQSKTANVPPSSKKPLPRQQPSSAPETEPRHK